MEEQPPKRSSAGYTLQKIVSGVGISKYDERATLQKIFSGVYRIPSKRSLAGPTKKRDEIKDVETIRTPPHQQLG